MESQISITQTVNQYREDLLKERTELKKALREAESLEQAAPIQQKLTTVETELQLLRNETVIY